MSLITSSGNPAQKIEHTVDFSFERADGDIFAYGNLETTVNDTTTGEVVSRIKNSILSLIGKKLPIEGATDIYRFDDVLFESDVGDLEEDMLVMLVSEFVRAALKEYSTDREIRLSISLNPSIPDKVYQKVIEQLEFSSEIDSGKLNRAQGYVTFNFL